MLPTGYAVGVPHVEQHKSPEEWPGDAGGIEYQVVEWIEARHVEVAERKVAHYGKQQQSVLVAADAAGVVIAFGYEEDHDGCCQASDDMKADLQGGLGLLIGLDTDPRQVVYRHGDDGNNFQCVSAQSLCFHIHDRFIKQ